MQTLLKYLLLLIITAATTANAQEFQGKAFYESKTTMDMDFGGREMSSENKKRIAESMKSMFEKTYILTFNKSESTYKEEEKLESPGGQGGGFRIMGSFTGGLHYKNIKEGKLLQEQEFFGKQFLINDSLPKLEWKMSGETKQIGNYTCYKATAIKEVDELDFRSMRRRDREKENNEEESKDSTATKSLLDEIDVPEEVTVTAWYTPQIPVSQGPGEYHGLPGLILEVNSDRTTILCSKIVLNPEEKEEFKIPSKGKEVTRKEYNEIMKKKMQEMREMYRGRGRGGERQIRIRG